MAQEDRLLTIGEWPESLDADLASEEELGALLPAQDRKTTLDIVKRLREWTRMAQGLGPGYIHAARLMDELDAIEKEVE